MNHVHFPKKYKTLMVLRHKKSQFLSQKTCLFLKIERTFQHSPILYFIIKTFVPELLSNNNFLSHNGPHNVKKISLLSLFQYVLATKTS